jgi:hypothetical protein
MARDLSLQDGIDNTDPDFINGKVVDNQTTVGEGINQDIIQFFQKLMDDSPFVANGNPDNEANGYQFVSALVDKITDTVASTQKTFTDRGDPANADFEIGDLTVDGNWHALGLGLIVPQEAEIVCIRGLIQLNESNADDWASIELRTNGNSNARNTSQLSVYNEVVAGGTPSAFKFITGDMWVTMDSNNGIEYRVTGSTLAAITAIRLTVGLYYG